MASYRNLESICRGYPDWARERLQSKRAASLSLGDVSGTEWPLLGTVFLFWSVEQLQRDWQTRQFSGPAPVDIAHACLETGAALLADPTQADWVQRHWGDDYLHEKNLFYRMMLIAGLDSYERLTGNPHYQSLLREQVLGLSAELARSPTGLLEDYPHETYPVDILLAYAALQRTMQRLELPFEAFVAQSWRAFSGPVLDPATGLPGYLVDWQTGQPWQPARGVGQSAMLAFAPELWPERATDWFERYQQQFWQERFGIAGFREFRLGRIDHLYEFEVDAGPMVLGFGVGASALGLAAARANNRTDIAVALAAEGLALAWQTPDGTMLGPRLLSNLSDAPYLGESALLFVMTRPLPSRAQQPQPVPPIIWWGLLLGWLTSLAFLTSAVRQLIRLWRARSSAEEPASLWSL
ncbi:hypothetical protein C7S18_09040 [Ahniella affigens]|uniref:Linalool dehydratase/isomerase domain-containing protein n=2 Tax=Ahniella affigens TaxID=2021234 RepID=A0A2P1PR82_9GAMM|nr:hypothetical protein C7S18_09040 [Ahniella affigens]